MESAGEPYAMKVARTVRWELIGVLFFGAGKRPNSLDR